MTRGMPLFIRDHFNLDPVFFCNSEALTAALEKDWHFKARNILSSQEQIECDRLNITEYETNVEVEIYISKDQQLIKGHGIPSIEFFQVYGHHTYRAALYAIGSSTLSEGVVISDKCTTGLEYFSITDKDIKYYHSYREKRLDRFFWFKDWYKHTYQYTIPYDLVDYSKNLR